MADLRLPRLNKVFLVGRAANDLELKFTPNGTPVMRFTLAVDKRYKDESDQWQTITSWIDCIAWRKTAEMIADNAHKGSPLLIEGRIETRNWTDQNNNNRKSTEVTIELVHFLEWKNREDHGEATDSEEPLSPDEMAPNPKTTDDDVPF